TTTSHIGLTRWPPLIIDATAITAKAIPANRSPIVNLPGLDGCRAASVCQMAPITGARRITNIAGTDWNQLEGYAHPSIVVLVKRSANSVRLEPACSYVIQNSIEKTNRMKITSTRLNSSP